MKRIVSALAAICLCLAGGGITLAGQHSRQDAAGIDGVFQALDRLERDSVQLAQADPVKPGVNGNLLIEPGDDQPIRFDGRLSLPGTKMDGRTIEELIVGTPLFPPIEGLDKAIWENKACGTCHQWTKERLCVQATTYIGRENMVGRLEHPYGLPFKELLEQWAEDGCQ